MSFNWGMTKEETNNGRLRGGEKDVACTHGMELFNIPQMTKKENPRQWQKEIKKYLEIIIAWNAF